MAPPEVAYEFENYIIMRSIALGVSIGFVIGLLVGVVI